jgi:hypothetical protein
MKGGCDRPHIGRGGVASVALILSGVTTAPAVGVNRNQEGWEGGSVSLEEGRGWGREQKGVRQR